jgi:hypothetical protein
MPASVELVALDFRGIPGLIQGKTELFIFLVSGSTAPGVVIGRAFETDEWPATSECLAMGGSGTPYIPNNPSGVFLYFKFATPITTHARVLALSICQNEIRSIDHAYVHHNDNYHPIPLWDGGMGNGEVRRQAAPLSTGVSID